MLGTFLFPWAMLLLGVGVVKLMNRERSPRVTYVRNRRGEYSEPYPVRWSFGGIAASVVCVAPVVFWLYTLLTAIWQSAFYTSP